MVSQEKFSRGPGRRGFTLLEIIMVVALVGVATTLFLVSLNSLGKLAPSEDLEAAFWRAMAQAREQALTSRYPVEVAFDAKAGAFALNGSAGFSAQIPAPRVASDGKELKVAFIEDVPGNEFSLVRGELVTTRPIGAVRVFPDGTCQAFSVQFSVGEQKRTLKIDPWTGARLLAAGEDEKGGRR